MKEYEGKKLTQLKDVYDIAEYEGTQALLQDTESGMYGGKNADGEDVIVLREVGDGMEILTFQSNGWLRANYFTEEGFSDGEAFKGRWDK